jgi:hypothetical protein
MLDKPDAATIKSEEIENEACFNFNPNNMARCPPSDSSKSPFKITVSES